MIASGLAVGMIVDVLIVRTLLVPALVAIMGQWNWWMPDRWRHSLGSELQRGSAPRRQRPIAWAGRQPRASNRPRQ